MKRILKSQQGFSLVELMVVVAIIGILAAMSVGQVQKQIAKSRQSEAKTNLATIYTAEKAFNAEWGTYVTDMGALGVAFDGTRRYAAGFHQMIIDDTPAIVGTSYTENAGDVTGYDANQPTNGVSPVIGTHIGTTTCTSTTFAAGAGAAIYNTTIDTWAMNDTKTLSNSVVGIP